MVVEIWASRAAVWSAKARLVESSVLAISLKEMALAELLALRLAASDAVVAATAVERVVNLEVDVLN